jgi:tRNA modification GTPase
VPGARSSTRHAPEEARATDTIAALATPSGEGAIAVVRVSGPAALEIAAPLIAWTQAGAKAGAQAGDPAGRDLEAGAPAPGPRRELAGLESHRLTRVTLVDPETGEVVDDALCVVMRGPRSYTGEDVVEISCHGSPALARLLLDRLIGLGARLAAPGEFTRRAFLNGRIDLAQAEAVALLISARTERAIALAARAMAGDLSRRLATIRQALIETIARLEVALDFPDDVSEPDQEEIVSNIKYLCVSTDALLTASRRGLVTHAGLTVAIVGAPNAGKSSLFNALLGRDRAIVTAEPGTTRDVLEGTISINGVPVRLLDTAGIGNPLDLIDAEAMVRSRRAMAESDFAILVLDGSRAPEPLCARELHEKPVMVVLAKSDLSTHPAMAWIEGVAASVKREGGLDAVRDRLALEVSKRSGGAMSADSISASVRQVEVLDAMASGVRRAHAGVGMHPTEIALIELRAALDSASELLGVQVGEAVLDAIFSRFCVGK